MPGRTHLFRCLVLALAVVGAAPAQTKLLRFPDIHGDKVVFTYGGDLWTASANGGTATRLTAHPGLELFGKFSPDGQWIAFTGQYDGDEQVYLMPSGGGVPRQLTFDPAAGPLPPFRRVALSLPTAATARELGASALATGHYVASRRIGDGSRALAFIARGSES